MLKPTVNNYSWYPVNYHDDVDSQSLIRIDLSNGIEVRYDSKKKNIIVFRSETIERFPEKKLKKIEDLKQVVNKFDKEENIISQLNNNKDLIYNIINN